jgi:hypothetical protein
VHREFFPLFALVENDCAGVGDAILAQRKLLFLEKLFASMLLGAPLVRDHLKARLRAEQATADAARQGGERPRGVLLRLLGALHDLLDFWLPAVFRIGYLARCCTWEGRTPNSAVTALELLEQTLVLLVRLTAKSSGKTADPYVRTISAALLAWQPWHSSLPACCYQEESCEAMLSRFGHRCDVHRNLHGFDATFHLYLTLTQSRSAAKDIRGVLRQGLVQVFAARIRKIFFDPNLLPFAVPVAADVFKTTLLPCWPDDLAFPQRPTIDASEPLYQKILSAALLTLVGKKPLGAGVTEHLDATVPRRQPGEVVALETLVKDLKLQQRPPRAPKPKPKLTAQPRPKPHQQPQRKVPKPFQITIHLIHLVLRSIVFNYMSSLDADGVIVEPKLTELRST